MVVGIGPGGGPDLTPRAREAILGSTHLIGYRSYVELLGDLPTGITVHAYGMGEELRRGREALNLALAGERVAVISGGDPGVYGMAGVILELEPPPGLTVRIVPGVTAATAAAAVLGAPLMNDFAVLSLSDLLTPRETILGRLRAVAAADLVTVLYNPASRTRRDLLLAAAGIFLSHRSATTPVAVVRDAGRPDEEVFLGSLAELAELPADMHSLVVIGNSSTRRRDRWLITPRGYFP